MIRLDYLKEQDLKILSENVDDPKINQYYMLPDFNSDEEKMNFAKRLYKTSNDKKVILFGIYFNDELVGFMNQVMLTDEFIEVGYVIFSKHHRKGYGLKALLAFIEHIKTLNYKKVVAGAFSENQASIGLLKKAGFKEMSFTEEIEYRGKVHECLYYEFVIQ